MAKNTKTKILGIAPRRKPKKKPQIKVVEEPKVREIEITFEVSEEPKIERTQEELYEELKAKMHSTKSKKSEKFKTKTGPKYVRTIPIEEVKFPKVSKKKYSSNVKNTTRELRIKEKDVSGVKTKSTSIQKSIIQEYNLKEDVLFNIRIRKDYKDLWEPLNTKDIKHLISVIRSILNKFEMHFAIPDNVIEFLKVHAFIKETNITDLFKFRLEDEQASTIAMYLIYSFAEEHFFNKRYLGVPVIKGNKTFNKMLKIKEKVDKIKVGRNNYDIKADLKAEDIIIKYALCNFRICPEDIIENAVKMFIGINLNTNKSSKEFARDIVPCVKNLAFFEFNASTNLEWHLMNNRMRKIRNYLTRDYRTKFKEEIDKAIKRILEDARKSTGFSMGALRESKLGDYLLAVDAGKSTYELQGNKK